MIINKNVAIAKIRAINFCLIKFWIFYNRILVDFQEYSRSTLFFFFFFFFCLLTHNALQLLPVNLYVNIPSPRSSVIHLNRQSFVPIVSPTTRSLVIHPDRQSFNPDRQSFTLIVSPSSRSSVIHLDHQCFIPILSPSPRSSVHHPDRTSHDECSSKWSTWTLPSSIYAFKLPCNPVLTHFILLHLQ